MKLNKLFLLAMAGLGLFACSNNEDRVDTQLEGKKNITLKISTPQTPGGRAITPPSTGDENGKVTTVLNDLVVYLYNQASGVIYKAENFESNSDEFVALRNTGYTFHNLDANVDAVAVVGNNLECPTDITTTKIADIETYVVSAAQQTDMNDVILFDEDKTLTAATESDVQKAEPGHSDPTNYYTAEVTIAPLVARIEIGDIKCKEVPAGTTPIYTTLPLHAVVLDNYYASAQLLSQTTNDAVTVLEEGAVTAYTGTAWNYDVLAADQNITETAWNPETAEGVSSRFAYNFIPTKNTDKAMPWTRLLFKDVKTATNTTVGYLYVTAKNYKFSTATFNGFEAGKIYKLNFEFDQENVSVFDNTLKCVTVTVSVQDWEIVDNLLPDFDK